MTGLVLSVTAPLVLSVTDDSSYQEPKQGVSHCGSDQIPPLNYANIESFRFLLTQMRLWTSGAARPAIAKANPASGIVALKWERQK